MHNYAIQMLALILKSLQPIVGRLRTLMLQIGLLSTDNGREEGVGDLFELLFTGNELMFYKSSSIFVSRSFT